MVVGDKSVIGVPLSLSNLIYTPQRVEENKSVLHCVKRLIGIMMRVYHQSTAALFNNSFLLLTLIVISRMPPTGEPHEPASKKIGGGSL